jgi:hypothetical protein
MSAAALSPLIFLPSKKHGSRKKLLIRKDGSEVAHGADPKKRQRVADVCSVPLAFLADNKIWLRPLLLIYFEYLAGVFFFYSFPLNV